MSTVVGSIQYLLTNNLLMKRYLMYPCFILIPITLTSILLSGCKHAFNASSPYLAVQEVVIGCLFP